MTTEERLARLTERHEALAQTVELLSAELKQQPPAKNCDEPKVIDIKWLGEL